MSVTAKAENGPTTRSTTVDQPSSVESKTIGERSGSVDRRSVSSNEPQTVSYTRLIAALAIVLGLIVLIKWLTARLIGRSARTANGAVRILSRTAIAPRQQILLIRVGRRILVLADQGTTLSHLYSMTDADEISELMGSLGGNMEPELEFETELEHETGVIRSNSPELDGTSAPASVTSNALKEVLNRVRVSNRNTGQV
jgi:flagellar biogenesis protein FliO